MSKSLIASAIAVGAFLYIFKNANPNANKNQNQQQQNQQQQNTTKALDRNDPYLRDVVLNESKSKMDEIIMESVDYAFSHGLVLSKTFNQNNPTSVIHAPFALLPSPFPKKLFEMGKKKNKQERTLRKKKIS